MPTYAYRCSDCGHQFDQFQRFSDDPLTDCPECPGAVRRVLQPVGVVFKGSGWYITDSRKSPSENGGSEKSDKSDKSEKAEKSEGGEKTAASDKPEKSAKPAAEKTTSAPAAAAASD